jgi:hypothetical protein
MEVDQDNQDDNLENDHAMIHKQISNEVLAQGPNLLRITR